MKIKTRVIWSFVILSLMIVFQTVIGIMSGVEQNPSAVKQLKSDDAAYYESQATFKFWEGMERLSFVVLAGSFTLVWYPVIFKK